MLIGKRTRATLVSPWPAVLLLPVLLLVSPAAAVLPAEMAPVWSLIHSDDERIVLEIRVPEPHWAAVGETGQGVIALEGMPDWIVAGGRRLPALDLTVALPPAGRPVVRVQVEGDHPLGRSIADLLLESGPDDDPGPQVADPLGRVRVWPDAWAATQRLLPLRIVPVRPDGAGRLLVPALIRVVIEISPPTDALQASLPTRRAGRPLIPADDVWGPVLERKVINPGSAALWRRAPQSAAAGRGDGFSSATAPWVRIEVERRGLHVLTGEDLETLDLAPELVDLASLRLFAAAAGELPENLLVEELPDWMEPCALWVEDDGDGLWDAATRVYFLGNGPDGWRDDLSLEALAGERYYAHPHARSFTYWLTWGGSFSTEPLWMETRDAAPAGRPVLDRAWTRLHREENRVYDPRPRKADLTWERFLWIDLAGVPSSVDLTLPALIPGSAARLSVAAWGRNNGAPTGEIDHALTIVAQVGSPSSAPRDTLSTITWDSFHRGLSADTLAAEDERVRVWLSIPSPRTTSTGSTIIDQSYLAWIEVEYERDLTYRDEPFEFFVPADTAANHDLRISGLPAGGGWVLLDASHPRKPVRLAPVVVAGEAGFEAEFALAPAGESARLLWLDRAAASAPAAVSLPSWSGQTLLRERTEAVDYLIVAPQAFAAAAATLAAHRRDWFYGAAGDSLRSARVAVVPMEQIFDEFSGGQHDPVALRNFARFAWLHWNGGAAAPTLSHLMLLGNAHYDPRGFLATGASDDIPSYLYYNWQLVNNPDWRPEHYGDDWLVTLDGPGDDGLDLALGRLPVMSATEAAAVVAKLIRYDVDPPAGAWRSRFLMAADDICQSYTADGLGWQHLQQTEILEQAWAPADGRMVRLYMIEYGQECIYDRKPDAARDLAARIDEGVLWFNFTGHGSETQLADERLLETRNLGSLANGERLFFFLTASCAVGKFAHGGDGVGVAAIRMTSGGAVGVVSASGLAASGSNAQLNRRVFAGVFPERRLTGAVALGPALWSAKTSDYNDRRYNLLGDPATRLAVPKLEIALSLLQGGAAVGDTLQRGRLTAVTGELRDCLGRPVTDYSGTVQIEMADSDLLRQPTMLSANDYLIDGPRIYSTSVAVENGTFTTEFFMPTALYSGERGPARLYAYALPAEEGGVEGLGSRSTLHILETSGQVLDQQPPEIVLAWENATAPVTAGSRITAVLSDSSGIYVAAQTPSRAVVISVIDDAGRFLAAENVSQQVGFAGDFRAGSLSWTLPAGLPVGEPLQLAIEASDNVMNRRRTSLDFEVTGGADGRLLEEAFLMPNPLERESWFLLGLRRTADVEVTIYTSSGRAVRKLHETGMSPDRARRIGLSWDGRDDDGDGLANGVYFGRITARDADGQRDERIERLVVLRADH